MTVNSAELSGLFTARSNVAPAIFDETPNADVAGVLPTFDVVLEIVAGNALLDLPYVVTVVAHDDDTGTVVAGYGFTLTGNLGNGAGWQKAGEASYLETVKTITVAAGQSNHTLYYTATLRTKNFQVASFRTSPKFIQQ